MSNYSIEISLGCFTKAYNESKKVHSIKAYNTFPLSSGWTQSPVIAPLQKLCELTCITDYDVFEQISVRHYFMYRFN